ncbi:MAG: lytic transglycosylase domain-containing protein [Gallionellaceae bacterium]|nr:lytic transglycosylase domain-containing protein [Gallionellaceae bacterium]
MTRFAFSFLVFLIATSAAAGDCFVAAGQRYDIHPWLLYAIADVESSGRPTAVNSGHAERTRSIDIGLMQINSRWLPKLGQYGIDAKRLLEPCVNVHVGAWILADLFARYGATWEAVGAYNAACTSLKGADCRRRRAWYANKVAAAFRRIREHAEKQG